MKNLFNIEAPIIQWMSKISWLLWYSCLWLICCLPVVTVGASTAALYRMAFYLREEEGHETKLFFRAFRDNWKQGTGLWLVVLTAAVVLALSYYAMMFVESDIIRLVLVAIFCGGFILWGFLLLYSFPLTCYFENTFRNTLVNCFAFSIKHLRQSILCFALAVIPVVALILSPYWFLRLLYVWVLFYPGLAAYWITGILAPVFEQYSK